jgi:hypothetical protein
MQFKDRREETWLDRRRSPKFQSRLKKSSAFGFPLARTASFCTVTLEPNETSTVEARKTVLLKLGN